MLVELDYQQWEWYLTCFDNISNLHRPHRFYFIATSNFFTYLYPKNKLFNALLLFKTQKYIC